MRQRLSKLLDGFCTAGMEVCAPYLKREIEREREREGSVGRGVVERFVHSKPQTGVLGPLAVTEISDMKKSNPLLLKRDLVYDKQPWPFFS